MKKLAVALMVKNESHIIQRCLRSIVPFADLVVITDTGSTDDTVLKAGMFLQEYKVPYKIYNEPFINFAHNRTRLLELVRQEPVDYVLMIDADEVFGSALSFPFHGKLKREFYNIDILADNMIYTLPRITSNHIKFNYIGATHEYLDTQNFPHSYFWGLGITQLNDSNRRLKNEKFNNDIEILEKALLTETNNNLKTRYQFYLAQSYQNVGNYEKALDHYSLRIFLGGWQEEIFYSYYQMGKIYEILGNNGEALKCYLEAYHKFPERIESLVCLRNKINTIIKNTPKPTSGLFLEFDKYETVSKSQ